MSLKPHHVPAEWAPHAAMWLAFPSAADLWLDDLPAAQAEVAALARAMAVDGGERVRLLVMGDAARMAAQSLLADVAGVELINAEFGDIWVRDTGPIFHAQGCARFGFNGWGGKYDLPFDDRIGDDIATLSGAPTQRHDWVLEGGALDHNGAGVALTTRQCLLNRNRNGAVDEAFYEQRLRDALGITRLVWLGDGLHNDHTDGHVDNLARFITADLVAVPCPSGPDDPHADIYAAARADVRAAGFQVVEIPSPGRVENAEGDIVPASHMNFIICNRAVIMPTYEDTFGPQALAALTPLFPGRRVIGLPALAILTGGGSFHCITQQEPA